jgi:hypothetical protein
MLEAAAAQLLRVLLMKKFILISMLALAVPIFAQAATLKFPADAPVATITIPDSWGPKGTATGVVATSADGAVFISTDVANEQSMEQVVSDAIDFLTESGVNIDPATQTQMPATTVNGVNISTIQWDGTDTDGPVSVSLAFVIPKVDTAVVVTYWGSKGAEDKHSDAIVKMLLSIRATK